MKKRFYFFLWSIWHRRSMWHVRSSYNFTSSRDLPYFFYHRSFRAFVLKRLPYNLLWDLKLIKYKILYHQPFWGCNGNEGGWRTDVCDFLEAKWRKLDNESK